MLREQLLTTLQNTTRKAAGAAVLAMAAGSMIGCSPAELSRDQAAEIVRASKAFTGPWDPGIRFDGVAIPRDPSWRRELIKVNSVAVRGTGLSAVADVNFSWRWNGGPFEGAEYLSVARLIRGPDKEWRVHEENLRGQLWEQERQQD